MGRKNYVLPLLVAGILSLITCMTVSAEEKKPIARVLDQISGYDEFIFKSSGNEILFAEIESDIYQTRGRKGGSTDSGCSDSSHTDESHDDTCGGNSGGGSGDTGGGGCSDSSHTDDTHDDSCGGSGGDTADMCLQVINPDGQKICWAGRPSRPGWQRDPKLACPLPEGFEGEDFTLRVFKGQCGNDNMDEVMEPGETPVVYLLNLNIIMSKH